MHDMHFLSYFPKIESVNTNDNNSDKELLRQLYFYQKIIVRCASIRIDICTCITIYQEEAENRAQLKGQQLQ